MGHNERREWIKKKIETDKKIEIAALSKELNVSEMTIRRDVEYLEKEGILTKVSKGAILNSVRNKDDIDDTLNSRNLQNVEEKKVIARYVSGLIEDGDVIFMDASTTVFRKGRYTYKGFKRGYIKFCKK
ncbi:MAG: DeoR family transcriptional regulator [Clostridium paraputrificum]